MARVWPWATRGRKLAQLASVTLSVAVAGAEARLKPTPVAAGDEPEPLRMVVMDPLADRLACACVKGHAQRKYDKLAEFLSQKLNRPVRVAYGESLSTVMNENPGLRIDVLVGKQSVVKFDTRAAGIGARSIAMLTDKHGCPDLTGAFVVRQKDRAQRIADLTGYRILFGPTWADEKHAAALEALKAAGVSLPAEIKTSPGCSSAALAVVDNEADAAVISSYAYPLLEGCGTIEKGSLRVVGETSPVPFVTVFVTKQVSPDGEKALLDALLAVRTNEQLLTDMESKDGFVRTPPARSANTQPAPDAATKQPGEPAARSGVHDWPSWRGPRRDGLSPDVPRSLPTQPRFLWRKALTGVGLSGIAATSRYVIVADKDEHERHDIFRCLAADSGEQLWVLKYEAAGKLDYGNSPRATPVIDGQRVYLLGAFGHLHCVELETGEVVWRKNLVEEFKSELVKWGLCSTPLLVDDKLIVNPGAPAASLVALDKRSGAVLWKSPGGPSAYASFILGTFGGVQQIVGYDAESLGGWNPQTGERLWKLEFDEQDFNVPTPVEVGGKLLVATENNGTRLYGFDERGRIKPQPLACSRALKPDASTPVVVNGLVLGCSGTLVCLDVNDGLRTLWKSDDNAFDDYAALISGNDRALLTTTAGELLLVEATGRQFTLVSRLRIFDDADVWSHPALIGDRLYVRNRGEIVCLLLK